MHALHWPVRSLPKHASQLRLVHGQGELLSLLSRAVTRSVFVLQTYEYRSRCLSRATLLSNNCSEEHIYENQPQLELLQQRPLKDYEPRDEQAVQVRPQRVFLKLVKGVWVSVCVCVRVIEFFPAHPTCSNMCLSRERESGRAAECAQSSVTLFFVFLVILEMCWNCVSVLFALLICHTLFNTRQWLRGRKREIGGGQRVCLCLCLIYN